MNISRKAGGKIKSEESTASIKPLFDINTLDFYCRYVISTNRNLKTSGLRLVKDLFDHIDESSYGSDTDRILRIRFIKKGLEARLIKKLNDKSLIIQYINGGFGNKELLDTSGLEEISSETLQYLTEQAGELVKSYFVDDLYDQMLLLSTDLKYANYNVRSDVVSKIQDVVSKLHMGFNKMDESVHESPMFSLLPGEFENSFTDVYYRETSPSKKLKTGIIGLNAMLGGGFETSRVYILFAQAAGGKSFTMIDLAMQIKNYNKDFKCKDPTKIPTILFLTMENSTNENVSREFSMVSNKSFDDCSLEQSMELYRANGLGYDPITDPIDIVMIYKANLSVNTDYLYTITDKLKESGREVICVFQDHIKRIRPVNKRNDLRLDLGEVVNEFKAFAIEKDIPIITDSHLNRDASKILDDSSKSNKKDLIRSLGSSNVSESYLMIDNCDFGVIINKELDSTNNLYLGFKCIKTRVRSDIDIFYQPYRKDNNIKLEEDLFYPAPLFKRHLKEDQPQMMRVSRRNDFADMNKEKVSEDDDLFTESVLGRAIPKPIDEDILLPRNSNQHMFQTIGVPSTPIFPMPNTQVEPTNYQQQNQYLLNLKYSNPDMKSGVVFVDENGIVINDGIEDLI